MASQTVIQRSASIGESSASFERFGGWCAILSAITGLGYALAFVVLGNPLLSGLFLMLGGLLSSAALSAVYLRLRSAEGGFALWGLVLGLVGALGAFVHGGYDLANAINPPATVPDIPFPIDPRGLLTFGVAGLALLVFASLIGRSGRLPRSIGYLSYLLGVLLIVIYLGRLIILDPTNPLLLVPVLLTGFIVSPLWGVLAGVALLRARGE